jgi:hypothetical protein
LRPEPICPTLELQSSEMVLLNSSSPEIRHFIFDLMKTMKCDPLS